MLFVEVFVFPDLGVGSVDSGAMPPLVSLFYFLLADIVLHSGVVVAIYIVRGLLLLKVTWHH